MLDALGRHSNLKMADIGDEAALKLLLRAQKRLEGNSPSQLKSEGNPKDVTAPRPSAARATSIRAVVRPEMTPKPKVSDIKLMIMPLLPNHTTQQSDEKKPF